MATSNYGGSCRSTGRAGAGSLLWEALLCGLLLVRSAGGAKVVVDPGPEHRVHAYSTVVGPSYNFWGGGEPDATALTIDSPVTVSVLRYHDTEYLWGQAPFNPGEVHVVVKSDCPDDVGDTISADIVTESAGEEDLGVASSVSIQLSHLPSQIPEQTFLGSSTFWATWSYISGFCLPCETVPPAPTASPAENADPQDETSSPTLSPNGRPSGGEGTKAEVALTDQPTSLVIDQRSGASRIGGTCGVLWAAALWFIVSVALLMAHAGTGGRWRRAAVTASAALVAIALASVGRVEAETTYPPGGTAAGTSMGGDSSSKCQISAEILLDGCYQPLRIVAPSARVLDVVVSNTTAKCNAEFKCQTDYDATMMSADELLHSVPMNETEVLSADGRKEFYLATLREVVGWGCERAVEGRPFLDMGGTQLQAEARVAQRAEWSLGQNGSVRSIGSSSPRSQSTALQGDGDGDLASEWTRRALGEHASVASFAAFVLALMSNGAPPDLVRDALHAALDEVRHAKASFEAASLLMGGVVEPGALPPSSHEFGPDLAALALGTAREGCVDETLSALAAAAEVDELDAAGGIGDDASTFLRDRIATIALEEGRHSALAWRTLLWVCGRDTKVCASVRAEMFTPEKVSSALARRRPIGREVEKGWKDITEQMAPLLAMEENVFKAASRERCNELRSMSVDNAKKTQLIDQLVENILRDVFCSRSSGGVGGSVE